MTALGNFKTIAVALALASAAGCGGPLNKPIDLVGTDPMPALSGAGEQTELNGRPSLLHGFDRSGWSTVTVQVPRNQVAHGPTYTTNFRWQQDRDPWNPAYPTPTDAIADRPGAGEDIADGLAQPFVTAAMLVWAPIDMILFTPPWEVQRSPSEPYMLVPDRVPAHLVDWFDAPGRPDTAPDGMSGDDNGADRPRHP